VGGLDALVVVVLFLLGGGLDAGRAVVLVDLDGVVDLGRAAPGAAVEEEAFLVVLVLLERVLVGEQVEDQFEE
jgi:hypothetical protein